MNIDINGISKLAYSTGVSRDLDVNSDEVSDIKSRRNVLFLSFFKGLVHQCSDQAVGIFSAVNNSLFSGFKLQVHKI